MHIPGRKQKIPHLPKSNQHPPHPRCRNQEITHLPIHQLQLHQPGRKQQTVVMVRPCILVFYPRESSTGNEPLKQVGKTKTQTQTKNILFPTGQFQRSRGYTKEEERRNKIQRLVRSMSQMGGRREQRILRWTLDMDRREGQLKRQ